MSSNREEAKRMAWNCFSEIPSYAKWDEGSNGLEDDIEKALDAAEQRGRGDVKELVSVIEGLLHLCQKTLRLCHEHTDHCTRYEIVQKAEALLTKLKEKKQ